MKFTKRMVLVPEEFMKMLEHKEALMTTPETKKMIRLEKQMDGILGDTSESEDKKVSQHNQNLQQFLDVNEKKRDFIPTVKIYQENPSPPEVLASASSSSSSDNQVQTNPTDEKQSSLSENEILESIPKSSRSLAQSMINRLKANRDQLTWNNKGEMVVDGTPVSGSNIIDLINDQLKSRKTFNPTGWKTFTESLDKINMPKYLMRNEKRRNYLSLLNNQETPSLIEEGRKYTFPPTPPTTPRTSKTRSSRLSKTKRYSPNWITY